MVAADAVPYAEIAVDADAFAAAAAVAFTVAFAVALSAASSFFRSPVMYFHHLAIVDAAGLLTLSDAYIMAGSHANAAWVHSKSRCCAH